MTLLHLPPSFHTLTQDKSGTPHIYTENMKGKRKLISLAATEKGQSIPKQEEEELSSASELFMDPMKQGGGGGDILVTKTDTGTSGGNEVKIIVEGE